MNAFYDRRIRLWVAGKELEVDIYSEKGFHALAQLWIRSSWQRKISYEMAWLGIPIVQLPEDILMMQELIYRVRPDIIVDCLDNFETRYLLNTYCIQNKIPLVHGAIWGMMGQVTFVYPPETPCLKCLFPEPPPKEIFPVVGATPGIIGCVQAMEALKYLTGVGTCLKGRLLIFDGEEMDFNSVNVKRSPSCPECGGL